MDEYGVIYADPPWSYRDKSKNRGGAERHYRTLSIAEIKSIEVPAAKDAMLFLWATWPNMVEALAVISAWGFTYKTCGFLWVKTNQGNGGIFTGMGHYTRANSEPCLVATKGKLPRQSRSVKQVVMAPRMAHSQKPDEVRRRIETLCGDVPRVEMFARKKVAGWHAWGDEIESDVQMEMGQ